MDVCLKTRARSAEAQAVAELMWQSGSLIDDSLMDGDGAFGNLVNWVFCSNSVMENGFKEIFLVCDMHEIKC